MIEEHLKIKIKKLEYQIEEIYEERELLRNTLKLVYNNELAHNQYYGKYSDCGNKFIYVVKETLENTGGI